jgi:integrase
MANPRKHPRLYLKRRRPPRQHVWIIRDGEIEIRTGCGEHDPQGAEEALGRYIARKFCPPGALSAERLFIDEVVAAYLNEHAQNAQSRKTREFLFDTARPTLRWWTGKKLADVNGNNCRAYVRWRTSQSYRGRFISDQTARHDLKTLRSAINWYHREHGPLPTVPRVTLPARAPQRQDYWLSRDEVATRIRAALESPRTRHVARLLLIGVYTGTRPGAILKLMWMPSATGGWFDLESGVLHRRGTSARQTNKRQPPARIHAKLLPHLKRWRALDLSRGVTSVIHYQGAPVNKLRNSWKTVAARAGAAEKDGPHITRHTAATWQMQAGTNLYEAAGYLGMSAETLWDVYGHHHPDFQTEASKAVSKRKRDPLTSGPQLGSQPGSRCSANDAKSLK